MKENPFDHSFGVVVVGAHTSSYVMRCSRLPTPGEYLMAERYERSLDGGKGSNQALALARLGGKPFLVAVVGDDEEGHYFLEYFNRQGVDLSFVAASPASPTAMGIAFMDRRGIPMGATNPGAILEMTREHIERAAPAFRSSRVLLAQLEIPVDLALYACRLGKENGLLTVLNPAPADELVGKPVTGVDVLTPNEPEAKLLAGFDPFDDVPIEKVAAVLVGRTGVQRIAITLGERGALLADREGTRLFPAPPVEAVDTAGAGDCFNAALALALGSDLDFDRAVDFAVKTAALSVSKLQVWPSFPTLAEVYDTYGMNW